MTFVNVGQYRPPIPSDGGTAEALRLLSGNPLLTGAAHGALALLAQHAQARRYRAGTTLFHEGDTAQHCLLVASGSVEVLRYDAQGEERMLRRFGPGELVAEAAMFMPHGRYPMSARAGGSSVVWRLPRSAWQTACLDHPSLGMCLLQALAQRLYLRINEVDWLTASKPPQRLAAYLLAQAGAGEACFALPTSQRQLAAQLGIRAETLNRLLAQWQSRGWISGERRRWRLCDAPALHRLVAASERNF